MDSSALLVALFGITVGVTASSIGHKPKVTAPVSTGNAAMTPQKTADKSQLALTHNAQLAKASAESTVPRR